MNTPRIAVFASGAGSNFARICKATQADEISGEMALLICDRDGIGAIDHANEHSVPYRVHSLKQSPSFERWDQQIAEDLKQHKIDFIVLAGFLKKIGPEVLNSFSGKMINTHPSLLPKFGGPGMYGMNVHRAVIEAGEIESGCTVHWVTENYDEGGIIAQQTVAIDNTDTPESLAAKVKTAETEFLVTVLKSVLAE